MLNHSKVKAHLAPPSKPSRVVKPRKSASAYMRIAVCTRDGKVWWEGAHGEDMPDVEWDLIELIKFLRDNWPKDRAGKSRTTPILLVCHNPHKVFLRVHKEFENDPEWKCRFSINTGEKFYIRDAASREPKVRTQQDVRIAFFGFRAKNRSTKYFHIVSPFDFLDDFDSYGKKDWPEHIRLYHWAGSVRKWVRKHNLNFSPTRGGLSAQLLRDSKFYPNARRKVPKLTNEKARSAMPGNFYAMVQKEMGIMYKSMYVIDQENAHHYAAQTVPLPDANSLFARGRFLSSSDEPYAREKTDLYGQLLKENGLYRVRMYVPNHLGGMLPPWASRAGFVNTYLYSNEIELAFSLGIEIRHISHAWTSTNTDSGLKQYAVWAEQEIKKNPDHKSWLKPTLLSAYGILGARPRHIEMAHWGTSKGEDFRYLLGPTPIVMKKIRTNRKIQPAIANTIHRGMIEAETRRLAVELARQMETEGHHVIGLHSDSILIEDDGQQLPLLPPPWRVKDRLAAFTAIDAVSFMSDTMTILPGRKRGKR